MTSRTMAWRKRSAARVTAAAALLVGPALSALALPIATGPNGANITPLNLAPYNLTGAGIRIGQVEGGRPGDADNPMGGPPEINHPNVNPGGAGIIGVAIVNRVVGVPTIVSPPPSGTALDDHAQQVAGVLVSNLAAARAPAFNATLFSAAYQQTGAGSQPDAIVATEWVRTNNGTINIINNSYVKFLDNGAYPAPGPAFQDGRSLLSRYSDLITVRNDVLMVQAGPEDTRTVGTLWDSYNNLVVAFTQTGASGRYDRIDPASNQNMVAAEGSMTLNRNKIDMCAPGNMTAIPSIDANGDGTLGDVGVRGNSGTSFAAPLVASTAALLKQYGQQQGLISDHQSLKAVLMNSASKHVLDRNGVPWPVAYAGRATTNALDPDTGVGQLNGLAAVRQFVPGFRSDISLQGGNVGPGGQSVGNILGGGTLQKGALIDATLLWDRIVTNSGAGANPLLNLANYASSAPPDLDLEIVDHASGNVVARSNSSVNNVEHVYFNVPQTGSYDVRVRNLGAASANFTYAFTAGSTDGLAFSVTPGATGVAPTTSATWPNDVNSLGTTGPANFQTQSEIFVSGQDNRNMARLSGALQTRSRVGPFNAPPAAISLLTAGQRGVLGLQAGATAAATDQMGDFSWGTDGTAVALGNANGFPSCLIFSVAGSPDIRKSERRAPFGAYPSAAIVPAPQFSVPHIAGASLGLAASDDLDALELDSPIQTTATLPAVDTDGDGMHNNPVYFTLRPGSPSLQGARTADDVFVSLAQDPSANFDLNGPANFTFQTFAEGATMGLQAGDAIDALVLSDVNRNGMMDAGDTALFSLMAGNPTGLDPGGVYFTAFNGMNQLFVTGASLGISGMDLDALDILSVVPEPSSFVVALLGICGAGTLRRRRQRRAG